MSPGDKRSLNKDHAKQTEGKKPRCVSRDVLAAVQNEVLHGFATNLEAIIRPMVAEEIDRAFNRFASQGRAPLNESQARKFHLQFRTNPAPKIFTKSNLEDENGDSIWVMLTHANTGQPVTTGPESFAILEVVPLMGNFNASEEQNWDAEEFEKHVAKEREGKGPLLTGELKVHLKSGEGTLGRMWFTDNSSITRSKKFRLGVRAVLNNDCPLMSIREGVSQAFSVIDTRGKAYKKHGTPSPTDPVWRLQNIGKGGPYHTKLRQNGIHTVKDFLSCLETRPECLKEVLGKMSEKAYRETIDNAKKCVLGDKIYVYPVEQPPYENLLFDTDCQVLGAVAQGHYVCLEMIDGKEKVQVDALVKRAYDNWDTDVTECALHELATTVEEPSTMIAPLGGIDGSLADVAVERQEGDYGSSGADDIPRLEQVTGQGTIGDVIAGYRGGFDRGSSSQDLGIQGFDEEQMSPHTIASLVQDIIREYEEYNGYGEPFQPFPFDDPSPRVGRWWLRIRTVVRCALFIRRAASARQLQP